MAGSSIKPTLMNSILSLKQIEQRGGKNMSEDDVLVMITASRKKGEIVYKVDCSSQLTNEEFEYYLGEIIKGICEWKQNICEENIRSYKGTIKKMKNSPR
jgi:hypothetical protein